MKGGMDTSIQDSIQILQFQESSLPSWFSCFQPQVDLCNKIKPFRKKAKTIL